MNLGTLITESQRLAGRVDPDWQSRTRRWINEAQDQWAKAVPWPALIRRETFSTHGSAEFILPPRVLSIRWLGDRTNSAPADATRFWQRELPAAFFGRTSGRLSFWHDLGFSAISRELIPPTPIIFRTTVSDTFSGYVAGLTQDSAASGTADEYFFTSEEISITGSGPVSSVHTYVQVETLGKDDFTPGDLLAYDGSSNLVARIHANDYESKYRRLEFLYVPPEGTQVEIEYIHRPSRLVHNYEIPNPAMEPEYLIWYAASMIHAANAEEEHAAIKRARADEILQRQIAVEKLHGEHDWRSMPEPTYWAHDDQFVWPENNG